MLDIRQLEKKHIPSAIGLCMQAQWNHIAADWERLLEFNPSLCLGGFVNNELVASCTLTRFGPVGWVGTFLVHDSLRGKGHGKTMFNALLEKAAEEKIATLVLDSSDAGRPIYQKSGFVMTRQGNELWSGMCTGEEDPSTLCLEPGHWPGILSFDAKHSSVDRGFQLQRLGSEPGACGRVILEDDKIIAFGLSRPGRMAGSIGPVVARDFSSAKKIINSLVADRQRMDPGKGVALAVLDNPAIKQWLAEKGLQMRRRNIRMFLPTEIPVLSGPNVFVSTGLGMG